MRKASFDAHVAQLGHGLRALVGVADGHSWPTRVFANFTNSSGAAGTSPPASSAWAR